MVTNAHDAIMAHYPDSVKYTEATERLLERIGELDTYCAARIEEAGVEAMMIYHPAYTYYAHHYALKQVAVEQEGKEPSPRQLATIVESARSEGTATILIQPQYAIDKVETLAKECGAEVVVTDPLAEDILSEIERVTEIICRKNE
jgi:zinc transport system substrate-binding protein